MAASLYGTRVVPSRSFLACILHGTVHQKRIDACPSISFQARITHFLICRTIEHFHANSRLLREASEQRLRSYSATQSLLPFSAARTCRCAQMSKSSGRIWSGLLKQTFSFLLLVIFTFVNVNPSVALADSAEGLKAELIKAQDEYIRARARDDLSLQDDSLLEPSSGPEQVSFLYQPFVFLRFRVSLLFKN